MMLVCFIASLLIPCAAFLTPQAHAESLKRYDLSTCKRTTRRVPEVIVDIRGDDAVTALSPHYPVEAVRRLDTLSMPFPFEDDSVDIVSIAHMTHACSCSDLDDMVMDSARVLRGGGILSVVEDGFDSVQYASFIERLHETLKDAGFVSVVSTLTPETISYMCWRSHFSEAVRRRDRPGEFEGRKVPRGRITDAFSSGWTTLGFQMLVAWTWGSILAQIWKGLH